MNSRSRGFVAVILVAPVAAMIATLFGATATFMRQLPPGPLEGSGWTARTRGWTELRGFYPAEFTEDRTFSWMSDSGRIRVNRIDRSTGYQLSIWAAAA